MYHVIWAQTSVIGVVKVVTSVIFDDWKWVQKSISLSCRAEQQDRPRDWVTGVMRFEISAVVKSSTAGKCLLIYVWLCPNSYEHKDFINIHA